MRKFLLLLALAWYLLLPVAVAASDAAEEMAAEASEQVIPAETFAYLATQHIEEALAEAQERRRYTIVPSYAPRPLRVAAGRLSYEVTTPNGLRYWGNTAVYIKVLVDGEPIRQVLLQCKIHMYDRVAVAARPLRARQILVAEDIRFEEQEIGTKERRYFFDPEELIGQALTRGVAAGQPILRAMVKKPVIIEAGAPVTIIANANGVEVQTEGVALEPGRQDDIIRARNLASRRIVRVRVIDAGTVEVLGRK